MGYNCDILSKPQLLGKCAQMIEKQLDRRKKDMTPKQLARYRLKEMWKGIGWGLLYITILLFIIIPIKM